MDEHYSTLCIFCDKYFTNRFSLSRHHYNTHKIPTCFEYEAKSKHNCIFIKKDGDSPEAIELANNTTQWSCEKCQKIFKRRWTMERHKEICKEPITVKDPYCCEYCNKRFKYTTSKYRHYKICAKKAQQETVVKVIAYKSKDMEFDTTSLNVDAIISRMKYASREELTNELLLDYAKELLKCPNNRCFRKTSLHIGFTLVFTGTEWKRIIDKVLYPALSCDLANHFSGFIYQYKDKFSKKQFDRIVSYIDYMADKGYVNSNDKDYQQQMVRDFQNYVKSVRILIHDLTVNGG